MVEEGVMYDAGSRRHTAIQEVDTPEARSVKKQNGNHGLGPSGDCAGSIGDNNNEQTCAEVSEDKSSEAAHSGGKSNGGEDEKSNDGKCITECHTGFGTDSKPVNTSGDRDAKVAKDNEPEFCEQNIIATASAQKLAPEVVPSESRSCESGENTVSKPAEEKKEVKKEWWNKSFTISVVGHPKYGAIRKELLAVREAAAARAAEAKKVCELNEANKAGADGREARETVDACAEPADVRRQELAPTEEVSKKSAAATEEPQLEVQDPPEQEKDAVESAESMAAKTVSEPAVLSDPAEAKDSKESVGNNNDKNPENEMRDACGGDGESKGDCGEEMLGKGDNGCGKEQHDSQDLAVQMERNTITVASEAVPLPEMSGAQTPTNNAKDAVLAAPSGVAPLCDAANAKRRKLNYKDATDVATWMLQEDGVLSLREEIARAKRHALFPAYFSHIIETVGPECITEFGKEDAIAELEDFMSFVRMKSESEGLQQPEKYAELDSRDDGASKRSNLSPESVVDTDTDSEVLDAERKDMQVGDFSDGDDEAPHRYPPPPSKEFPHIKSVLKSAAEAGFLFFFQVVLRFKF